MILLYDVRVQSAAVVSIVRAQFYNDDDNKNKNNKEQEQQEQQREQKHQTGTTKEPPQPLLLNTFWQPSLSTAFPIREHLELE